MHDGIGHMVIPPGRHPLVGIPKAGTPLGRHPQEVPSWAGIPQQGEPLGKPPDRHPPLGRHTLGGITEEVPLGRHPLSKETPWTGPPQVGTPQEGTPQEVPSPGRHSPSKETPSGRHLPLARRPPR